MNLLRLFKYLSSYFSGVHNPFLRISLTLALFALTNLGAARGQERNAFGSTTISEAALIGVLYDLKQTQDRRSTNVDPSTYSNIVDEFLCKDWDEGVLNRYFRVATPLYLTQIFIPNIKADAAPKAFGAENTVKPSRWIIHYKGQISPPVSGSYRFWGCADDLIAVAVNGKTVLVANRPDTVLPFQKWRATEPDGARAASDYLRPGDWMDVKTTDIIDLDIIIGERPGQSFNAFLMIEKKGEVYGKDARGHSIFPIFQVAPYDTPVVTDINLGPLFATGYPPWKSYQ